MCRVGIVSVLQRMYVYGVAGGGKGLVQQKGRGCGGRTCILEVTTLFKYGSFIIGGQNVEEVELLQAKLSVVRTRVELTTLRDVLIKNLRL